MTEKAPPGLGPRGSAFWKGITTTYTFSPPERELVVEAARTLDLIESLRERGDGDKRVLVELRQQRIAFARILAGLSFPEGAGPEKWTTIRARKAAQSRWRSEAQRRRAP
jgi:hypothetical protein